MRRKKTAPPTSRLPRATPDELVRMLIPPVQALDLVLLGTTADAVANATRSIGKLRADGLDHLACGDIVVALAELDLRAKALGPEAVQRVRDTHAAIAKAEQALDDARRAHASAKTEVLATLGYRTTP